MQIKFSSSCFFWFSALCPHPSLLEGNTYNFGPYCTLIAPTIIWSCPHLFWSATLASHVPWTKPYHSLYFDVSIYLVSFLFFKCRELLLAIQLCSLMRLTRQALMSVEIRHLPYWRFSILSKTKRLMISILFLLL